MDPKDDSSVMHVWLYAIVTLQYNCSLGRHWLLIIAVVVRVRGLPLD